MDNHYRQKKIIKTEYACEVSRETANQKWRWLDRKIPLHFVLLFSIFVFGATFFASNKNTFFVEAGKIGSASLQPLVTIEPNEKNNQEIKTKQDIIKLPLSNNVFYKLPLSGEKDQSGEEKQKLRSVVFKLDKEDYPDIKINRDDYKDGKYIEIDISRQVMMVYGYGELKGLYLVSTGMQGMRTPLGTFKIIKKSATYWSNACNCWMPYAMQFTDKGIFIHELPYYPGKGREGENNLGYPVSHGCVRLGVGDAQAVFEFAEVGTPVIVHQ